MAQLIDCDRQMHVEPRKGARMRNIFLLYIPPTNHEAVVHYEETIRRKVLPDSLFGSLTVPMSCTRVYI